MSTDLPEHVRHREESDTYRCEKCETDHLAREKAVKCCSGGATPGVEADKTTGQDGHYHRSGIEDVAAAHGRLTTDGLPNAQCLGVHDHYGWYQTRPLTDIDTLDDGEFDERGACYLLADDYSTLATDTERTQYATTNYQDPDALDWHDCTRQDGSYEWRDDDSPLPGYEDILGFALLADVDLADEHKERPLPAGTRETVEQALAEYADAFAELIGSRERVFVLDSVGGAYLLTPPAATAPIARAFDGDARARVFEELRERADAWLSDVCDDVNAAVAGVEGVFEADLLNQVNRQYKAPLSLHSSIDGVVHPIDVSDDAPDYEFIAAEDVDEGLINETAVWATEFTHGRHTDAVGNIVARLWPEYAGERDGWKDALEAWLSDEREAEAEQRRRDRKAAEERARRRKERDDDLPAFTDAVDGDGIGIATAFDDVQAAVDEIDARTVVQKLADGYDTAPGRDPPRFNPGYRDSNSGSSCFVDSEKIVDPDDTHKGIGVLDYAAREKGYITAKDTTSGEDRAKARNDLRGMDFDVPIYTPAKGSETHDGEEYEQMPGWARAKAAVALGVCEPDDVTDGWKLPSKVHDALLNVLEDQGIEHGCEPLDTTRHAKMGDDSTDDSDNTPLSTSAVMAAAQLGEDDDLTDLTDREKAYWTWTVIDNQTDHHLLAAVPEGEDNPESVVYRYDDGVWTPAGEQLLRTLGADALGPQYSENVRRELIEQVRARAAKPRDELGADSGTVATQDRLLTLDTRETRDIRPEDHILRPLGAEYDPNADCPRWEAFLDEVVRDGDTQALQEYVGYCLMHWQMPYKRAALLLGPQDSGKSTFLNVVKALLGGERNVSAENLNSLVNTRWGSANLHGQLANITNELETTPLETLGTFKTITGGGDLLTAERKGKDPFKFTPLAKHMFAANRVPPAKDTDDAFHERWLHVRFPETIPKHEQVAGLDDELEAELPGVLNWALDGYDRLTDQGAFTGDQAVGRKRELWEAYGNSIKRFKSNCLEITGDGDDAVVKKIGHSFYATFCEEWAGTEVESQTKFTRELTNDAKVGQGRRVLREGGKRRTVYTGVKFAPDALEELHFDPGAMFDAIRDDTDDDEPDDQQDSLGGYDDE